MVAQNAHRLFRLPLDGRPTVTAQSIWPPKRTVILGCHRPRARAIPSKVTEDTAGFGAGVLQHTRLYCDAFENAIVAHLVPQRVPSHWERELCIYGF